MPFYRLGVGLLANARHENETTEARRKVMIYGEKISLDSYFFIEWSQGIFCLSLSDTYLSLSHAFSGS